MAAIDCNGPGAGLSFPCPDVSTGVAIIPMPNGEFKATTVPTQFMSYYGCTPGKTVLASTAMSTPSPVVPVTGSPPAAPVRDATCSTHFFLKFVPATKMTNLLLPGLPPKGPGVQIAPANFTTWLLGPL